MVPLGRHRFLAPWTPEANDPNTTVIEAIGASAARFASGGYEVVVDRIIGPSLLERFVAAAGHPSGPAYVILRPSREATRSRALGRAGAQDRHDPGPVSAMYEAFEDLGAFARHLVDPTGQDAETTLAVVATGLEAGAFTPS